MEDRAFGEKVFDVIEATSDRLREVDGIGPVRAASILAAQAEQKAVREINGLPAIVDHKRTIFCCYII
jgi:hypothetical protein